MIIPDYTRPTAEHSPLLSMIELIPTRAQCELLTLLTIEINYPMIFIHYYL